jgi:hypothetical protein
MGAREARPTGSKKATANRQRESHAKEAAKTSRPGGTHKKHAKTMRPNGSELATSSWQRERHVKQAAKKAMPNRQRESHGQQAAKKTRPDGTHKRLPWNNALSFGLPDSILASLAFLPLFVGTIV